MAANTLVHTAPGWALREKLTSAQLTKIDQQAAQAVSRNATHSGTRVLPLLPQTTVSLVGGTMHSLGEVLFGELYCHNYKEAIWLPLHGLLHGHTLTSVQVHVKPEAGHSSEPEQLPKLKLYKQAEGTATLVADTGNMAWTGATAYEAGFDLVIGSLSEVVDLSAQTYWLAFNLEGGTNSVDGLQVYDLAATMTVDASYGGKDFTFWV